MRIGILGNAGYEELDAFLDGLRRTAAGLGADLLVGSDVRALPGHGDLTALEGREEEVDALLTLGGDGTLLRGARIAGPLQVPLLGCNMGRLGFLTAVPREGLDEALERLVSGRYELEQRMALRVRVLPPGSEKSDISSFYAVNDAVVHKSGFARLITIRIWVDGEEVGEYNADGIVLATATGSTAYSLSAGGPVLAPDLNALVATPICPHTLAVRSLVLSGDCRIQVQALSGGQATVVTVDGQQGSELTEDHQVEVRRAETPLQLVRFPERTFFSVLRRKLGWGAVRLGSER